jgi:hypothetical protein
VGSLEGGFVRLKSKKVARRRDKGGYVAVMKKAPLFMNDKIGGLKGGEKNMRA